MSPEARTRPRPSQRARYRYVVVRVLRPSGLGRGRFIDALRRALPGPQDGSEVWLTRFDGTHGVLRCLRGREKFVVDRLPWAMLELGIQVETLSTSGSIAALERRHRDLDLAAHRR